MKLLVALCLTVVLFAMLVGAYEHEVAREIREADEEYREEYCNIENRRSAPDTCYKKKCNKDNTGCPLYECTGDIVGFTGDPAKPYPGCCMDPICVKSNDECNLVK